MLGNLLITYWIFTCTRYWMNLSQSSTNDSRCILYVIWVNNSIVHSLLWSDHDHTSWRLSNMKSVLQGQFTESVLALITTIKTIILKVYNLFYRWTFKVDQNDI